MGILRNLFRSQARAQSMLLEAENQASIENPTEEQVRELILSLKREGPSFASLTDENGNYAQAAGSRPWCVVERRQTTPLLHERAFQQTPNPKYNDGAKISTGAGDIELKHDEWFLLKDAAEVFVSFLHRRPFPSKVEWRSLNEMLGI